MGALVRTCMLTALAVVAIACGADDTEGLADDPQDDAAAEQEAAPSDGEEEAADDPEPGSAGHADLAVASSDLGDILVDGDGMTLYLFTEDGDGESVCEGDCAAAWPPLLVEDEPVAGEGVDADLLGETERSDGTTQVTYAGWPLYTWAQDQQPGDVTGQGVQEVWFVVSPEGDAVADGGGDEGAAGSDGY
jgi:predicted lipoprotein with Yx(FWY)xxD motif